MDNICYFWFQHRNGDPENEALSKQMFEAAKTAFIEDRDILVEVHKGMKFKRSKNINLAIDAGSMRFRKMIEKRIASARNEFSNALCYLIEIGGYHVGIASLNRG